MVIDNLHLPAEGSVDPKLGDKFENSYLKKASDELKAGFRLANVTKGGESLTIKISHPNVRTDMELSNLYTAKYNTLMRNKQHMTRKEIEQQLKERGVWTDFDEKKLTQLQDSMQKCLEEFNLLLSDNPSASRLTELRTQYYDLRDKIFEVNAEQSVHFINSIESLCDHEQLLHKIIFCIKDKDENPIWDNWEALMNETDRSFLNQVIREGQLYWSGLTTEVLYSLPDVLENIHQGATSEETSTE